MTYAELLQQLQQLNQEELQKDVVLFDLYKEDGYDDVQFDCNNMSITFGEN